MNIHLRKFSHYKNNFAHLLITPNPDLPDMFRESPDFQFLHRASALHAGVVAVSGGVYLSLYMLS